MAMLSTFHDDSIVDKRRRTHLTPEGTEVVTKPTVVEDYNQSMGRVDKADQLVLYYGYAHRSAKWWKRIFFHMVDLALVNAHILHTATHESKMTQLEFRVAVAERVLDGHERQPTRHRTALQMSLPLRLTKRAFPEPILKDTPCGGHPRCGVCRARKKQRSQTQYRCKTCHVPHPCFELYHTKLHYNV